MKHKFKPSVSGNRGKRGASGGGTKEKQSDNPPPASPVIHHEQTRDHASSLDEQTAGNALNESETVRTIEDTAMLTEGERGNVPAQREGGREERESGGSSSREVADSSVLEERRQRVQLEKPPVSREKTAPTTAALRVRKRVAPAMVSSRPLRSTTKAHPAFQEREKPVSTASSSNQTDISSSSDLAQSDHTSSLRILAVSEHSVAHTRRSKNDVSKKGTRKEGVIPDALDLVLDAHREDADDSCGTTGNDNLSGMVRSSLDLVCPPPMRGEGATFEMSREERRLNRVCAARQDSGSRTLSSEGGGCMEGGEEERETEEEMDTRITGDETCGNASEKNTREQPRTRLRKRLSESDKTTDASPPGTKKGKSGASNGSRSPSKLRKAPDRAAMTMQELIYYNPSANPMSSSVEVKKRRARQNGAGTTVETNSSGPTSVNSSRVSTPAPPGSEASSEVSPDATWGESQDSGRLVPQLRMGKDGRIILDEDSMVVPATARHMPFDDPLNPPLFEGCGHTTSASYRRRNHVTRWTGAETTVFFRALSQVGTDFTMMTLLLPKRSRKELKNKFKKEERSNPHRVSLALKNQTSGRPAATRAPSTTEATT